MIMVFSCSTAGNWLFCNRRWLNPLNREERKTLETNYETLCAAFPILAMRCPKANFIQCIMDVSITWSERIGKPTRATATTDHQGPAFGYALALPAATGFQHPGIAPAPAAYFWDISSMAASPSSCHHSESSAHASPYDSADDGPAREQERSATPPAREDGPGRPPSGLNAGEAVDLSLHEHWATSVPALRVDARELERFGRSTSF
jgi:hypothetical protein